MQKKLNKIKSLVVAAFVVIGLGAGTFGATLPAFAVSTNTWTGTACNVLSSPNCNWSNTSNWSTGVVPVSGDSVVFTSAVLNATNAGYPVNDISSLSLNTVTFTGTTGSSNVLTLTQPLTVTGAIVDQSTAGATINGSLVLGADVTVSSDNATTIGLSNGSSTLALAGHTLTIAAGTTSSEQLVAIDAAITGSGGVIYSGQGVATQIYAAATYSGTTQVLAGTLSSYGVNAFGTSTVYVANGASATIRYAANTTVNNTITVQGVTSGSQVTSLNFDSSAGSPITITVPHIVLNGATRFGNNSTAPGTATVDLAGITANNHCVEYIGSDISVIDGPANGFINGPAGCILSAAVGNGIGAPNTAVQQFITGNPVLVIGLGIVSAAAIAFVARRSLVKNN